MASGWLGRSAAQQFMTARMDTSCWLCVSRNVSKLINATFQGTAFSWHVRQLRRVGPGPWPRPQTSFSANFSGFSWRTLCHRAGVTNFTVMPALLSACAQSLGRIVPSAPESQKARSPAAWLANSTSRTRLGHQRRRPHRARPARGPYACP